jgi:hypothetical protein
VVLGRSGTLQVQLNFSLNLDFMLSVVHPLLVVRPTLPMQQNWEHCLTETWLQIGTVKIT